MITNIKVNGFKSLEKFDIKFNEGLNVLIGPNGVGKSNICQAVGLLSSIAEGNIANFILSIGGIKSVFSLFDNKKKIEISCEGICNTKFRKEIFKLKYKYAFILKFANGIKVDYEDLRIYRESPQTKRYRKVLFVKRIEGPKFKFFIKDKECLGPNVFSNVAMKSKPIPRIRMGEAAIGPSNTIFASNALFFISHAVKKDMSSSKVWNIDPHAAKKTSDLIESDSMAADGRLLANAIHAMKNDSNDNFNTLNALLKRLIPSFEKVVPKFINQDLTRSFSVEDVSGLEIPANCVSDGTIKLISLLVGIFEQKSSTAIIEEPENYLHPWACQTLMEYFRDYFLNQICVITTHSETILNCTKPSELIIVTKQKGRTNAERISNVKNLTNAIRHSGFGCGYHYLAGSFGDKQE